MARNGKENPPADSRAKTTPSETAPTTPLDWRSALIDLAFEPILAWDWEKGIIEWNAGAERQYGFERAEVMGKNSHELLATKYPISLRRFLKRLEADGYWIGEVRHTTKDGRELIVESRQQVIVQNGRRLVMESNRDITERREGEGQVALLVIIGDLIRKLTDPEELLFAAAKALGEYFNVTRCLFNEIDLANDREVIHRDYCRGVASLAGTHKLSVYSPITTADMRAGLTVTNNDSKADRRTAKLYKKAYAPAGERSYVAVPLMHDGEWKASLWISDDKPREWAPSEISLLEVVAERVWHAVERRHADVALRKSEALFSRFMQYLPGLAWIKDANGKYLYANDAVEKAFGTSRDVLYGKTDDEVFPEPVAGQFKNNDRLAVENGTGLQTVETLMHDDGVLHHSIVSKFPIFEVEGESGMIGGIAIDITDRVKAEEALRESEERRKLAQEAGNVGIFDWDIRSDKTYWSETMWSIYGEDAVDVNPDDAFWSEHLHHNDRERVRGNIRRVVRSKSDEFRDEFRIVLADGSIRWIEARAAVLRDPEGAAIRMYGVNTDITTRKEAEEKLRLSDNQLRLVTNAMPALISYVDKNETYRFVNQRYDDWFGVPVEEVIGKGPRDVFGPEAYKILKPNIDKALSGQQCMFETIVTFKTLGKRYVHVSYIPDVGADGTIYGYYGLTQDLTDLKHSEDLLRSSEERIGLMMESLTDYAIFSTDVDGRINTWNKGAEIIFGYLPTEIIGRPYEILFTAEDISKDIPQIEMETAKRKKRASDERWLQRKDGESFFANGVLMPLHVGKSVTGFVKIVSDLTEKKRHAEELQRAHDELDTRVKERTKELAEANAALVQEINEREIAEKHRLDLLGRLVSSQEFERRRIARDLHDQMGQRLTALRLKIASLHETGQGTAEFTRRVTRLQEISEQLDSEVSFLAWELRPTTLDDLGLLEAVEAYVTEWSRHYEIPADFHSSGLPTDRLDHEVETHLYRIAQEALNNIAKHADATRVTVLLERREGNISLIVEDDGKGFDQTKERSSRETGTGLGLIGMGERAVLIGGDIEVESAAGKGTTIFVRVPFEN